MTNIHSTRHALYQMAAMSYMERFDFLCTLESAQKWAEEEVRSLTDREVVIWYEMIKDGYSIGFQWNSEDQLDICIE